MKMEMEISGKKMILPVAMLAVGLLVGYAVGMTGSQSQEASRLQGNVDYLKTTDLNRTDIQASILLSRFCEGLGLKSSVYWQQDAQGNVFGTPICLQPDQ